MKRFKITFLAVRGFDRDVIYPECVYTNAVFLGDIARSVRAVGMYVSSDLRSVELLESETTPRWIAPGAILGIEEISAKGERA